MMRHLNSQHYHNHQIVPTVEQHLHRKVDLLLGPLVTERTQIIWAVMAICLEYFLPSLDHRRGESLLEARIVVRLHLEGAWDHHLQVEVLVKMGGHIHVTLLVQEVGKGQQEVLFILDRR